MCVGGRFGQSPMFLKEHNPTAPALC